VIIADLRSSMVAADFSAAAVGCAFDLIFGRDRLDPVKSWRESA
jgi:hypothetical protein